MCTDAGDLPNLYVFHTPGPKCKKRQEDISKESKVLKNCVRSVFDLMVEKDCRSLASIAISTGIYNFPLDECGNIFFNSIIKYIDKHTEIMQGKEIFLCKPLVMSFIGNFDDKTTEEMIDGRLKICFNFLFLDGVIGLI